jgi:hypothetical protein
MLLLIRFDHHRYAYIRIYNKLIIMSYWRSRLKLTKHRTKRVKALLVLRLSQLIRQRNQRNRLYPPTKMSIINITSFLSLIIQPIYK